MKSTGIIRKVDELGRVVIPKEIRDSQDITEGTPMEIYVEGSKVIIEKYKQTCSFCKNKKNLIEFMNQEICPQCLKNIKEILQNKEQENN